MAGLFLVIVQTIGRTIVSRVVPDVPIPSRIPLASCLPSAAPHWPELFMPQIVLWAKLSLAGHRFLTRGDAEPLFPSAKDEAPYVSTA